MDVESGSKAQQAGLTEGDIILEIGHVTLVSVEEWDSVVSQLDESDTVTLTIARNGKFHFVIVE